MFKSLVAALAVASALAICPTIGSQGIPPGTVFAENENPINRNGTSSQMIFFSVLEGLYTDGVSNEVVDAMLEKSKKTEAYVAFVYACPICHPAIDALRLYRGRPEFFGLKGREDTFGKGLPAEVSKQLTSTDLKIRRAAWHELMQVWIERRLVNNRLTEKERADWILSFAIMRKQGMGYLEAYKKAENSDYYIDMDACPSCDAAVDAAKK